MPRFLPYLNYRRQHNRRVAFVKGVSTDARRPYLANSCRAADYAPRSASSPAAPANPLPQLAFLS
jgi:hypothetical protein